LLTTELLNDGAPLLWRGLRRRGWVTLGIGWLGKGTIIQKYFKRIRGVVKLFQDESSKGTHANKLCRNNLKKIIYIIGLGLKTSVK